jgi:hypothetical protein
VNELEALVSKKSVPNSLQKTINTAIENHNTAVKNIKLIQAANSHTETLVNHISDSMFFFTYSDAEDAILRNDLKLSETRLDELLGDIKTLKDERNKANNLASAPNHEFTSEETAKIVEAYKTFSHDAEAAAIQSTHLEDLSREDRARAVKVAELYGQFLEGEDSVCKWAIIILVLVGSAHGLLGQLGLGSRGALATVRIEIGVVTHDTCVSRDDAGSAEEIFDVIESTRRTRAS